MSSLMHAPSQASAVMTKSPRFLLVAFPVRGHINPALQLAKRLASLGSDITFVTAASAHRRFILGAKDKALTPLNGVSFATFSDEKSPFGRNFGSYNVELRRRGSQALAELIESASLEGRPYAGLVYTILLHWVVDVAAEFSVPATLLWTQAATVFDVCYYYFHGYGDIIRDSYSHNKDNHSSGCSLTFPGLLLDLSTDDLPSFMDSSNPKDFLAKFLQEQFDAIDRGSQGRNMILVNTFDELEPEALRAVAGFNAKLRIIGIGPLISAGQTDQYCNITEWLNSKPKGSVVYVSFGSVVELSTPQMEEIAKGLLDFGHPFLWIIRKEDTVKEEEEKLSCQEELERLGMIVPWCRQVEVLANDALRCFMSHCGWNSTLESLACGVPLVAFPQGVDQTTNAKLVEEWKVGVRVKANKEGTNIVGCEEIKRCLELVMDGEEMRRNANKWKDLAREASKEGGILDRNLKTFVNEMIN